MTANDKLSGLFRALSHPHRRITLYYLREHDRAALETLAECVAGWLESGPGGTTGAVTEYETVRTQLHHTHLPMLAEMETITYDAEARTVQLCDVPTEVETVISTAITFDVDDADAERLAASVEE